MQEPAADPLWVRYLDWCSARIARRFLEMSPSEVWERAERSRGKVGAGREGPEGQYLEMVRALTLELFDDLALTEFDAWVEQYLADPVPFDREVLGFGNRDHSRPGPAHT